MKLLPKRRKIAETNLKLCFPEKSEQERTKLLKQHFQSTGLGLLEAALAWWASIKSLNRELISLLTLMFCNLYEKKTKAYWSLQRTIRILK